MVETVRRLNPLLFSWNNWRSGTIHDLGINCRFPDITSNRGKQILRDHTIGYCKGENLMCRPKEGHTAIMCFKNGTHFWFHLRNKEFQIVFSDGTGAVKERVD